MEIRVRSTAPWEWLASMGSIRMDRHINQTALQTKCNDECGFSYPVSSDVRRYRLIEPAPACSRESFSWRSSEPLDCRYCFAIGRAVGAKNRGSGRPTVLAG